MRFGAIGTNIEKAMHVWVTKMASARYDALFEKLAKAERSAAEVCPKVKAFVGELFRECGLVVFCTMHWAVSVHVRMCVHLCLPMCTYVVCMYVCVWLCVCFKYF